MSVSVTREPSGLVRISRRVPPALDAASTGALRFDLAEVRDFALAVKAGALDALLGLPLPETGPEPPSRRRGHPVRAIWIMNPEGDPVIDNRQNPTKATCIPACGNTISNPDNLNEREFCRLLVAQGWLWHVDYQQVCTHCPEHPFTGEHPNPGQYD